MSDGYAVPRSHVVDRQGVHLVAYKLGKLGWGAAENSTEDVGSGIDLVVFARRLDDRPADGTGDPGIKDRFIELGLGTGQVKTGPSYFSEETSDGWVYRDSNDVLDRWTGRSLPHFLFLADPAVDQAWWVEVTRDGAVITGAQFKITVPRSNEIGQGTEPAMREAVLHPRAQLRGFAGTVWNTPGQVSSYGPVDELRAALIVPRMIAPHPSTIHVGPVSGRQALALVAAGRWVDLERGARQRGASELDPYALLAHDDWAWKFAGALRAASFDDISGLNKVIEDAPDQSSAVCAIVVTSCVTARSGRLQEACRLLDEANATGSTFDLAWISAQRGRFEFEWRQDGPAATAYLDRAAVILATDSRPFAAALLAGVAAARWTVSRLQLRPDLAVIVTTTDVHANWWAAESQAEAFGRVVEYLFDDWSCSNTITMFTEDVIQERLGSTVFLADVSANHGRWRANLAALGRITAVYAENRNQRATGLERLRRSGDHDAIGPVVQRLMIDGADNEVRTLIADPTRPEWWNRTTTRANWRLLTDGGCVLDREIASKALLFALGVVTRGARVDLVTGLVGPSNQWVQELDAMAGLATASDDAAQSVLCDWLFDELSEHTLGDLFDVEARDILMSLSPDVLLHPSHKWTAWAFQNVGPTAARLLGRLAMDEASAASELESRATKGDLDCAWELLKAGRRVPAELAPSLSGQLNACLAQGRYNTARHRDTSLTIAALIGGNSGPRLWEPIVTLLQEPTVEASEKLQVLMEAFARFDHLPGAITELIARSGETIAIGAADEEYGSTPSPAALLTIAQMFGNPAAFAAVIPMTRLVRSVRPPDRYCAAWLLGRSVEDRRDISLGHLSALVNDPDHDVRAQAALSIARRVARQPTDIDSAHVLLEVTNLNEAAVAQHIGGVLCQLRPEPGSALELLQHQIENHADARVRLVASRAAQMRPPPSTVEIRRT